MTTDEGSVILSPAPTGAEGADVINQSDAGAIRALFDRGVPKKVIARQLGLDIKTVRKYLRVPWQPQQRPRALSQTRRYGLTLSRRTRGGPMSRAFILVLSLGLSLYVVATVSRSANATGPATRLRPHEQVESQEITADETPSQVVHGRVNSETVLPENAQKIVDFVRANAGRPDITLTRNDTVVASDEPPSRRLGSLVSASDAIVIGTVTARVSKITADGYFLFSDYTIRVEEVLKSVSDASLTSGDSITVTRRGGQGVIDGILVTVDSNRSPLLEVGEARLLLFLEYMPETRDYSCNGEDSAFTIDSDVPKPLSGIGSDFHSLGERDQFLDLLREDVHRER